LDSKKSQLKTLEEKVLEGNYEIKILKEKASLERYVAQFDEIASTIEGYAEIIEIADEEIRSEIFKELPKIIEKMKFMEMAEMFSDEADKLGVVLEINSGAGGTESQDWAEMLERMYIRWAEEKNFKMEMYVVVKKIGVLHLLFQKEEY